MVLLTLCFTSLRLDVLQMYDDTDQASSAMTDIDPFWDMRSNSERDKLDPFRDRDQFWRK
jgi:hypothetical protein